MYPILDRNELLCHDFHEGAKEGPFGIFAPVMYIDKMERPPRLLLLEGEAMASFLKFHFKRWILALDLPGTGRPRLSHGMNDQQRFLSSKLLAA